MKPITSEEALEAQQAARRVVAQIERVMVGKREAVELVVTALLARGHVLIEDIPGVGKTMLAKSLARAIGGTFKRIQFTPDLLPGDVTGMTIYNQRSNQFDFNQGPIFANIVLADEINRATPKTQSALLESMEEAQSTIDGQTRALPSPFFVIATQNPIEYRGTYPLPEAQMDRFLVRVRLGYPARDEEIELLARHTEAGGNQSEGGEANQAAALLARVEIALDIESARRLQAQRARVFVSDAVREYIVSIVAATRVDVHVALGASPRGALALQRASQAAALLEGRAFVTPDDVKKLAPVVLAHRVILQSALDAESSAPETLVQRLLDEVAVP